MTTINKKNKSGDDEEITIPLTGSVFVFLSIGLITTAVALASFVERIIEVLRKLL